jgi:DNA-binding GntR family transcriptional regulator
MTSASAWISVSLPYVSGERGDAWAAEAAVHGGVGRQRLLAVEEVTAPAEVAEALNLEPGAPVVVRRRLMLLDEHPVELVESYYPTQIARGTALAEPRKIRGGAVALLAELGHRPRRVREDVTSRLATEHERNLLGLDDPAAVQLLARVLYTDERRPVEASLMTGTGRLRYELDLGAGRAAPA